MHFLFYFIQKLYSMNYLISTCVKKWRLQHIFVNPISSRTCPSAVFLILCFVK